MSSTHTSLHFHLVFSTKDRLPSIKTEWRERMHAYLGGTVRGMTGAALTVGGVADHVHLLVGLKPTHPLSDVLRDLKKNSSTWVHEQIGDPRFQWQEGYGAFSVSHSNLAKVARYIERQERHHAARSYEDEYRDFLKQHEIEFEERFLW
jgi:putative transposase